MDIMEIIRNCVKCHLIMAWYRPDEFQDLFQTGRRGLGVLFLSLRILITKDCIVCRVCVEVCLSDLQKLNTVYINWLVHVPLPRN